MDEEGGLEIVIRGWLLVGLLLSQEGDMELIFTYIILLIPIEKSARVFVC